MSIEEAIAHAREVAEGCPAEARQCAYQHDKLADWLEELKAYRETGLTPGDIANWIYWDINSSDSESEKTIRAVESALGFKLFIWQKCYIERGEFRWYGETTAMILRDLLNVSAEPIDYSRRAESKLERLYRQELRKIKEKLDRAGIPTRTVFFSQREKWDYLNWQRRGNQ